MKESKTIVIAVVAVIISIVAVIFSITIKPAAPALSAGSVGQNELANNAVNTDKISDGTITSADIANNAVGSAQIADNSIALGDISSDLADRITGMENIADNSITSAKIADGTITDSDIAAGASISPDKISGTAWTSTNDGSGSGLDADTVDGLNSTQFLRNDTSGTLLGNLAVNGSITHQTETRYYTVPFSAFRGATHDTPYRYYVSALANSDAAFVGHKYYAPVNLPDGATITRMTVRYHKPDAAATVEIYLENLGTARGIMAFASLPQTTDFTDNEITVSGTVVSNNNAYWLVTYLDPNDSDFDAQLAWVSITYTITKPLP